MSPSPPNALDNAFEGAGSLVLDVLQLPEVAATWTEPSALPGMSVGALCCHLGRQLTLAADLLPAPTQFEPLDSVDEHYRRAAWVNASPLDNEANDHSRDDAEAELGLPALLERTSDALARAVSALNEGRVQDVVAIPWQGWSLHRDDFLLTRMLEMVVHTEDLAASIDQQAPAFDELVIIPVVELLARLAVERHGQTAVVSTLSRRERAHPVWAF